MTIFDRFALTFAKDPLANGIAVVWLVVMLISVVAVAWLALAGSDKRPKPWPFWIIPVLCFLGLFVAGYLTFIETTKTEAVCGPIGDCNAVQNSSYAKVFGILPVGLLGMAGYVAILVAWLVQRYGPAALRNLASIAMWGMAIFGVLFSIYLTFLEPFVIGATCVWCISSAVLITILLWATTPAAADMLAADALEDE
jgi:uncharacterized membrane protein